MDEQAILKDTLSAALICTFKYCKRYLECPISLPCGHNICKEHLEEAVLCFKCGSIIPKPYNGYKVNESLSMILAMNLQYTNERQKRCKQNLDELRSSIKNFELPVQFDQFNIKLLLQLRGELENSYQKNSSALEFHYAKLITQFKVYFDGLIPELNSQYNKLKLKIEKSKKKHLDKLADEAEKIEIVMEVNSILETEWNYLIREPNLSERELNKLESNINRAIKSFELTKLLAKNLNQFVEFIPSNNASLGKFVFNQTRYYQNGVFEGETVDGKRNGTGKFYYYNDDSNRRFEGKRVKHRPGQIINAYSEWMIQGEWKNDRRHGTFRLFQNNQVFEIQEWKNDKKIN
jgi:hypothetical protein